VDVGWRCSHVSVASTLLVVWAPRCKGKGVDDLWLVDHSKMMVKGDYDPAYRAFVFYRTMSPNEVCQCWQIARGRNSLIWIWELSPCRVLGDRRWRVEWNEVGISLQLCDEVSWLRGKGGISIDVQVSIFALKLLNPNLHRQSVSPSC